MPTLFEKIIAKEIPANLAFEDDRYIVIHDIQPQAPVHILVIPKKVVPTLNDLTPADGELVGGMFLTAKKVMNDLGHRDYRTVFNCNADAGQTVFHVHLHLLAGRGEDGDPLQDVLQLGGAIRVHQGKEAGRSRAAVWHPCTQMLEHPDTLPLLLVDESRLWLVYPIVFLLGSDYINDPFVIAQNADVIAGQGTPPDYGEYVGVIGPEQRGELMSRATACFAPSYYIEPFGNVAVEAQGCGTPVLTTDWGAFTETVIDGVTGFRCRTFGEFVRAAEKAKSQNPYEIRRHAVRNYTLEVIGEKYERYFERLSHLFNGSELDGGFYEGRTSGRDAA